MRCRKVTVPPSANRSHTASKAFAGKQGCWPVRSIMEGTYAHLRALRVRGALRFSRSRSPLMRMSAKLRSQIRAAVRPFLRPSSWPLRKASPMSAANAVVTMMMVNGSMCFYVFLCIGA
jgi:hypothetical protein